MIPQVHSGRAPWGWVRIAAALALGIAVHTLVAALAVWGFGVAVGRSSDLQGPAETSSRSALPEVSTESSPTHTGRDDDDVDTPGAPGAPAAAESPASAQVPVETETPVEAAPWAVEALDLLETLDVKGRAPKTGYDRKAQFGPAWEDVDDNGCDTRNDILLRDLIDITVDDRCRVLTGVLNDPYTGKRIDFVRGADTSAEVQIDHVVALMDAWQKGAQQMTPAERLGFANDPLNLLAVDGAANQQKGAGDAATWLPKNKAFRCEYVARQIEVKAKWGLWVTTAERVAMQVVLSGCP